MSRFKPAGSVYRRKCPSVKNVFKPRAREEKKGAIQEGEPTKKKIAPATTQPVPKKTGEALTRQQRVKVAIYVVSSGRALSLILIQPLNDPPYSVPAFQLRSRGGCTWAEGHSP